MIGEESTLDPVAPLAEDFAARYRRGERPALSEYTQKYPELAEQIRQVFPLVVLMEEASPEVEASSARGVAGPARSAEPTLGKPEQLGGYRILREIGRGGMGVVYEAEQVALGRHVALKVLPLHVAQSSSGLERFRREARAAARLHHTNIVPVYDVGEDGDVCYYAMQFIHGRPFDQVLEELRRLRAESGSHAPPPVTVASGRPASNRPAHDQLPPTNTIALALLSHCGDNQSFELAPPHDTQPRRSISLADTPPGPNRSRAAGPSVTLPWNTDTTTVRTKRWHYFRSVTCVGIHVAEALEYAHKEGVLHRDIKPSNLLLDTSGRVWVADFGLAKTDGATLTQSGDFVGTIPYTAPERFRGWSDPRSDVYSLGLTLYEMLILQPAFATADRLALMHQVMHEEAPRLQRVDPQVPRDLATIIAKAIDKEPSRRYQTAGELAADLQRFVEDRPILARQTRSGERAWRWCRRNPAVAGMAATVALLVLVVMLGATIAAGIFRQQRDDLADQASQLSHDKTLLSAANVHTETSLWKSNYSQAQLFRWSGLGGRRSRALQALSEAATLQPHLKPEDWHTILRRPLGPDEADKVSHALVLRNEAIASLALTDLRVVKEWQGLSRPDIEEPIDFSPDLDSYARAEADGCISIRQVADDGIALRLPVVGKSVCRPIRFSPDGRWLTVKQGTENGTEFFLWDVTDQTTVRQPVLRGPTRHDMEAIDVSPDGRWLAVDAPDGSIGIYDLTTRKEAKRLRPDRPPWFVRFDPSGEKLAVSSRDSHTVQIWDLKAGKVVRELAHPRRVAETAWSPDGRLLAAAGGDPDDRVYVWDAESGVQLAALEGHKGSVWAVAFHPHADLLVSYGWDGKTRLWDFRGGRELLAVEGWFIRFSRDGRHLAFRNGRQVGLWEVATAEECRPLYGHDRTAAVYSSAVSPDGFLLVTAAVDGIRLWDAVAGRQVAALKELGQTDAVAFDPAGGGLFTCTRTGLYLWPVRAPGEKTAGRYQVGPPEPVPLHVRGAPRALALSQDGNVLAVDLDSWQAVVIHRREGKRFVLNAHNSQSGVAVSPDGSWVATGNYKGSGIHVWDSRTGERKREFPAGGTALMTFSPDNQWLVISEAGESRFYRVDSWQPRPPADQPAGLGHCLAFTRDGQVMAVGTPQGGVVRLVQAGTGQELATLEITPSPSLLTGRPTFSPDGSQLVVHHGREGLRAWDLRKVRARLEGMGLDWDLPPYPPAGPATGAIQVEVNRGSLAGQRYRQNCRAHLNAGQWQLALVEATRAIFVFADDVAAWRLQAEACLGLKQYEPAMAAYRHSRKLGPPDAQTENGLAWAVVAEAGAGADLVAQAVEWAQSAVNLAPEEGTYWNTLGVAHYRAGQWDKAITALNESIKLQRGREYAHDAFFLAMAYWKRGEVERARNLQSAAIGWMDRHAPDNSELRRFHAEVVACARAALGQELDRLTRAVESKPEDAEAYFRRGKVHSDLIQHEQARDDFAKVLALAPKHVEAYHYRGHVYEKLKKFREAVADFSAALGGRPENGHLLARRGLSYLALPEFESAVADLEKALKGPLQSRDRAAAASALAWVYVTGPEKLRDPKKALPHAQRADQLEPRTYTHLNTLGVVCYRLDEYENAREALTRAAELRKQGPTASNRFVLAMCHHRLGADDQARLCFDQALASRKAQTDLTTSQAELLNTLRAEAEALLKAR